MDILFILQIFIGFIGLVALAIPFSDNFKTINYRYVLYGILAQIILAVILLKLPFVVSFFEILVRIFHSDKEFKYLLVFLLACLIINKYL